MKYQYDRAFKIKLFDDMWECYIVTEEEALELDDQLNDSDDGFRALTVAGIRCLFIHEEHVTIDIVTHELIHIFYLTQRIDSANLNLDQQEEIFAELFEHGFDKFSKTRKRLYKKFAKLQGES